MVIVVIIFGALMVLLGGIAVIRLRADDDNGFGFGFGIGALICGILSTIALLVSLNLQISDKDLTGYIYSSSDTLGYTTAHIRFSQNAGTDAQPKFCVKTDSDPGHAIQKYVGSEIKVKVHIPPYFYFANNPFACGTTGMTVQEIK